MSHVTVWEPSKFNVPHVYKLVGGFEGALFQEAPRLKRLAILDITWTLGLNNP